MRRAARPLVLIVSLAAAAPLTAATGSLSIESQPGVEVVWDGTVLGRTDARGTMLVEGIPPGEYVIDLSKTGYRRQRQRILVTEGPATFHGYLEQLERTEPPKSSKAAASSAGVEPPSPPPAESESTADAEAVDGPAVLSASRPESSAPPSPRPAPAVPEPATSRAGLEESAPTVPEPVVSRGGLEEPAPARASGATPLVTESAKRRGLMQVFLAIGIALAGGLAIFFTARRPSSVAAASVNTSSEVLLEKTVSASDDSRFIENLKQRERALDDSSEGARRVIEVEVIDVQEIEGDA